CPCIIDAIRPTGEDDALRPQPTELCQRGAGRQQFAVDVALTYASGDQATVLSAVVQDGDHLTRMLLFSLTPLPGSFQRGLGEVSGRVHGWWPHYLCDAV